MKTFMKDIVLMRPAIMGVIFSCMVSLSLLSAQEAAAVTIDAQVSGAASTFSAIPGITITAGGQLTITASGSACFDTACTTKAFPAGSGQGNGSSQAKLPGAPLHSLVCGIGGQAQSNLFFVGNSSSQTVNKSGSLFCGMNEDPAAPGSYADNRGSWTVRITFTPAGGGSTASLSCWMVRPADFSNAKLTGQICLDLNTDSLNTSKKVFQGGGFFFVNGGICDGTHPALFTITPNLISGLFMVGVNVMMVKPGTNTIVSCYPVTMEVMLSNATKQGAGSSWNREEAGGVVTGLKELHPITWTGFIELSQ